MGGREYHYVLASVSTNHTEYVKKKFKTEIHTPKQDWMLEQVSNAHVTDQMLCGKR